MKKICFITTIYPTFKAFLKNFAEYLYKTEEYDISLICDRNSIDKEDLPNFVHFYPVKMKRGVSLSAFSAIHKIKKIFKKHEFDIVQYSTPNAAFYASIAAKKSRIPVRLYCQWGIRYMGFKGWKRILFKYLEKKTCDNSTYIEVESHNIRNFSLAEKLYSEDASCVIWNGSASGVDLSKFNINKSEEWRTEIRNQFGLKDTDVVYSFAGRLTADKGVNELLAAFLNVVNIDRRAKLMLMGAMENSKSIDSYLMEMAKGTGCVFFTGCIEDIERYYAASDVFVAPSYREGFGLVVIEAEAMGLPAIVSNVPGQIDAIIENQTGLTCNVKDVDSLENAMIELLNNAELRNRFGLQAAQFAKENFEQGKLFSYLKAHRDELING